MMPKPFLWASLSIEKASTKSRLKSEAKKRILPAFFSGSSTGFSTLPPPITRASEIRTKASSNFKNISL